MARGKKKHPKLSRGGGVVTWRARISRGIRTPAGFARLSGLWSADETNGGGAVVRFSLLSAIRQVAE